MQLILGLLAVLLLLNLIQLVKEHHMSAELDRLTADVTDIKGKADSLIALVNGLAQLIRDSANDPAALNALADSLEAESSSIQAAIDANPLPTPPTP